MKFWSTMLTAGALLATPLGLRAAAPGEVGMIRVDDHIGPATASYIGRAIAVASKQNHTCLIIQLDTPGGLISSMKEIIQAIYVSEIPIVVYVAPAGATATSAGTFITMAADVAVMAPDTTIGAAHPVSMGLGSESTNDVMSVKAANAFAAYAETVARRRHRNGEWAQLAVRESVSIRAEKAVEINVIDFIAKDVPDLLRQLDGREVRDQRLKTAGATVVEIPMSFGEKLFRLLRPEVMFIVLLVAIYGIIGEINNPGAILPGVVGAIALILFLYMNTYVPVNVAGIALILLAVALFVIDIYAPSHGVLTVGGVVAFFLGSLLLFNRVPGFHLSLGWIIPATAVTALFFLFVVGAGLRAQRLPVQAGKETMIGKTIPAGTRIDGTGGRVFVEGENWNAVSDTPVEAGQNVEIIGIEGLTLKVKPKL